MQEQIGMMRFGFGMLAVAMLAGCGSGQQAAGNQTAAASGDGVPLDDGKADCALAGSGDWARDCVVDRSGDRLTIRHPDGGFRRFRVLADGRGLEAADGAEAAKLTILDDKRIEVVAGDDHYRLPARMASARP
jgi:hypothetical protein